MVLRSEDSHVKDELYYRPQNSGYQTDSFLWIVWWQLPAIMKVENGPRVEKSRAWVLIRPVIEQVRIAKTIVEVSSNDGQDLDEDDNDDEAIVRTAEDQEKVEILHSN